MAPNPLRRHSRRILHEKRGQINSVGARRLHFVANHDNLLIKVVGLTRGEVTKSN